MPIRPILVLLAALLPARAGADELRVAVASNFSSTLEALGSRFEAASGHRIVAVVASSGKHYAQIRNGAPLAVFLSADARLPQLLERQGLAAPESRFTYAIGALVLWSPRDDLVDPHGEVLERHEFRHLAIANPRLAPYGRAAREVLDARGLSDKLAGHIVQGESIAQAFQFVSSGSAELGFVALSQLLDQGATSGSHWLVPPDLHAPIEQQAVLLEDREATRAFARFLQGEEAREIIRAHGYTTP